MTQLWRALLVTGGRAPGSWPSALALVLAVLLAHGLGGCSTALNAGTPLPDLKPIGSTAMSPKERDRAIEDLNRQRDHEAADAEREIESSR